MADTRAQELSRIGGALFEKRRPYDQTCQNIAELFYPMRADFTTNFTLGDDFAGNVMDSFTINSRETLGNSIDAMLRQGDWFAITTGDEERDERAINAIALERATKLYRALLKRRGVGFDQAMKQADHDWVAFGSPVLSWEENPDRNGLMLRTWHPKLCAWIVDETGKVTQNHRRMTMTARDIKGRIKTGKWSGTIHKDIDACAEREPMREFPIEHVLMPIEEIYGDDAKMLRRYRHQYLSLYIDTTHNEIVNQLGSRVFNYIHPRYRTLTGLAYGFSPLSFNSLPDARMLQAMATVILEQGEKAVDPPIVGASDVFVRDINLYAGGFTSVDLDEGRDIRNAMQVVDTSGGIQTGLQLKQDVRSLIAEAWLLNKLFLPNVREMRELEVATRNEEFRRAALPFFNPIESEYHSPVLGVGFEMAVTLGYIDPGIFPEELQGEEIEFAFESPLKEAEGQKVVAAFQQSVALIAAGSEAEPGLARQFNIAEATIDAVRGAGAKPDWIKSEDQRRAAKNEDEQAEAISRTAAVLQQGAGAVADVSNAAVAAENSGLV